MIETATARFTAAVTYEVRDRAAVPLLVATVTLLAWARLPWDARKVVWAEDGNLFLTELLREGFWETLFKSYTGYLQFWPRILVEAAVRSGDLGLYSDRVAFLSCVAVGLLAGGTYIWSRTVISSRLLRVLIALLPVLVSTAPVEVLGNVANLHWFLIWPTFWLVMHRPCTRGGAVALGVLGGTFALTEIQVAVVAPLFLINAKSVRAWVVRAGLLLGLVMQGVATIAQPRQSPRDHLGIASTAWGYIIHGPMSLIVGDSQTAGSLLERYGLGVALACALPFIMLLVFILVRGDATMRCISLALVFTSVAMWGAAVRFNLSPSLNPTLDYAFETPEQLRWLGFFRYGYVPSLCLLGLAVLALAVVNASRTPGKTAKIADEHPVRLRVERNVIIGTVGAVLLAQAVFLTPAATLRTGQPQWAAGIEQATADCSTTGSRTVEVPQAPSGWQAELPCSALDPSD